MPKHGEGGQGGVWDLRETCSTWSREEGLREAGKSKLDSEQTAAASERNKGDEGFVEDYIDFDHHDEERVERSHPDNLSTSSQDEEPEVSQHTEAVLCD